MTISMDMVNTLGLTAESMLATGRTMCFMAKEFTNGKAERDMKVTILMTKSTVKEHASGPMAKHTQEAGKMENNTAKVCLLMPRAKAEKDSGRMTSARSG